MKHVIIILLIASSYLFYKAYSKDDIVVDSEFTKANIYILKSGGEKIEVSAKVADDSSERAQGLMFVKEMPENEGMLFIFEEEEMRKMWMENTYIPLDMLFVNSQKTIFNFKESAKPLSRDIIYSVGPAKYVIELNAGFIKRHNIAKGDKIEFEITGN